MYISEELLRKEYNNPKIQLRDIINEFCEKAENAKRNAKDNTSIMLQSLGCFNSFCKRHNFEELKIDHELLDKYGHGLNSIKNYQSKFLLENSDLYDEYFTPFKYEFKTEKLEELKKLVFDLKSEIKASKEIDEKEKEAIVKIIDEIDNGLRPKTNDIDSINGKIFRLHISLNSLKITQEQIKSKVTTIFNIVNNADSFINKVYSISEKISGLIDKASSFLS